MYKQRSITGLTVLTLVFLGNDYIQDNRCAVGKETQSLMENLALLPSLAINNVHPSTAFVFRVFLRLFVVFLLHFSHFFV